MSIATEVSSKSVFRILPAGMFKASDGRPATGHWMVTATSALKLIQDAASSEIDYVIDYEHQSMDTQGRGPAPAAGWFKKLEWRTDGLYTSDARWTPRAKAMLDAGEYRFISPVFTYDKNTGEITRLISLALTNTPALHTLTDLSALSRANNKETFDRCARLAGISPEQLQQEMSISYQKQQELSAAGVDSSTQKLMDFLNICTK